MTSTASRGAPFSTLALRAGTRLLEIGYDGGLLLREAVAAGASATGLDHSLEMVSLAGERARGDPGGPCRVGARGRVCRGGGPG